MSFPSDFLQFDFHRRPGIASLDGVRCGANSKCIFMIYNSIVPTRKQRGGSAHPLDVSVQLSDRHPPAPDRIEDIWWYFMGFL